MTRKIFLSIMAAAAVVLLCSVLIIMGCLYDYFGGVQERQLEDELALAQTGVECSGKTYLKALEGDHEVHIMENGQTISRETVTFQ